MSTRRGKKSSGGSSSAGGGGKGGGSSPAAPAEKYVRVKLTSMGDTLTGKSCLIKRFCEGKFVSRYISTIGVDFGVKPIVVKGKQVRINFFDLSGHSDLFEVRNEFYKDTQGLVIVYDVSNPKSFVALDDWIREAKDYGGEGVAGVVCANKVDKKRAVSEEDGKAWASKHGFAYFETSANSGQNVVEAFSHLVQEVLEKTGYT